jgi:hypothetical protein
MKCIKNKEGEIRRVKEDEADLKVNQYGWNFVPKSEWKLQVRGVNKKTVDEVTVDVTAKSKKVLRRSKFKVQ